MPWRIRLEAAGDGELAERSVTLLRRELARYGAELDVEIGRYIALFPVGADLGSQPQRALARATGALTDAVQRAGMPEWPLVAMEAVTIQEHARRSDNGDTDGLAGVAEVAELLGVSRQRVGQLRGRLPEPMANLRSGPVWSRRAVAEFEQAWDRTPGRPRKTS
jgi:hypothetical protein